jgi:chaperonin cofactor prefoldin
MSGKKIGIWAGGSIGLFIVLLILMYFLFPLLHPKKARGVKKQKQTNIKMATFNPVNHNLQAVDSLRQRIGFLHQKVDSLAKSENRKQQVIDSLTQVLQNRKEPVKKAAAKKQHHSTSVKEASKSLLNLEENSLGPIVNLLNEDQLINLYKHGSTRQREKLLRTLDPKKAASILKRVMK